MVGININIGWRSALIIVIAFFVYKIGFYIYKGIETRVIDILNDPFALLFIALILVMAALSERNK